MSLSSALFALLFSRTATAGWRPSNSVPSLPLVAVQSTRSPSKFPAPPTSTPNSPLSGSMAGGSSVAAAGAVASRSGVDGCDGGCAVASFDGDGLAAGGVAAEPDGGAGTAAAPAAGSWRLIEPVI